MKNYLSVFFLSLLLIAMFVFLLDPSLRSKALAQFPTFEIYREGGYPYPEVSNVSITGTETILVTSEITDPSGVYGAVVKIENEDGDEVGETEIMYDNGLSPDDESGDNIYTVAIDATGLAEGKYFVNILARDALGYSHTWEDLEWYFVLGASATPECQTSESAQLCIITNFTAPVVSNPVTEPCQTSGDAQLCISRSFFTLPQ